MGLPPSTLVNEEWEDIKSTLKDLQAGTSKKSFMFEDICPYPFDPSNSIIPFPKNFEISKFDKYKGRGDPQDHLQELYMHFQEVLHDDNYLLHLFPQICIGQELEWFMCLPRVSISTFANLLEKFITHFSFNLDEYINNLDLLKDKQCDGEMFSSYLQRWQALASRLKCALPEKELVDIFVTNSHPELAHNLHPTTLPPL